MAEQTKRARRHDATPPGTVARALAEAEVHGDAITAKRYKVSRSALRAWRRQAVTDEELRARVSECRAQLLEEWRPAVTRAMVACCRELERRIEEGAEGLSTMELIGALRTLGTMSVEAGALLGYGPTSPESE